MLDLLQSHTSVKTKACMCMSEAVDFNWTQVAAFHNFDKPFSGQSAWNWLFKFLQGDFGKSLISDIPTKNLMIPAVMNTIQLSVITLMVSLGISIPLSIFFVRCHNRIVKSLFQLILFFNMSLPSFVIGYFLMYVFSVQLKWFPLLAKQGGNGLMLPILTLVIPMSAKFIQQFSVLLEQEL